MYFERVIEPILNSSCVRNQGGCHEADPNGNALGNLDLTTYANATKRADALRTFGPFPLPLLLIKGAAGEVPPIPYQGSVGGATVLVPNEVEHAGGQGILTPGSQAFLALERWLSNGATEDGAVAPVVPSVGGGACSPDFATIRPDVAADLPTVDTSSQAFKDFTANVEPFITKTCALGTCHSSQQSDFFLTCQGNGSNDASKFNFLEAQAYVAAVPSNSPLLLKPLAPAAGGIGHTGGTFFQTEDDSNWKNLSTFANEVGVLGSTVTLPSPQAFFYDNVMPIFLRRGCAFEGCHSPGAPNDFKLRAGLPGGFFTSYSLAANYKEARNNFLVAEIPDVRQSRIVKKPITSVAGGGVGLVHRGGPPLQSPGEVIDPTLCPQPWTSASTPFCTVVEWHRQERGVLLTTNTVNAMNDGDALGIVAVVQPPNADRLIDFDTYRPGADLVMSNVTVNALGAIDPASGTAPASLLGNCAGATAGTSGNADVRHPAVSYDATKVAFAMRLSATDTLDIYEVTLDAAHTCTKVTNGAGQMKNGLLMHNLDPMYAADGTLVFASTRGGAAGPTRSLKYLLPQTDLWRMSPGATGYGTPQQMTALLGSELSPAMMLNGQMSFTAEKASADFYQLSGRRINWDLTDYHPLLAQRSQSFGYTPDTQTISSPHPSVNYQQATEIREGPDRNFVLILSDDGTKGAGGTVATFNRSIGPFEADRTDITFVKSLQILDAAATGRAGATQGAYRAPFPLPDGKYLVSYSPDVTNLATAASVRYDLVVIDPTTGGRTNVAGLSGGANSYVSAVLVYKREPRPLFDNVTQLVFGGHVDSTDTAHGHVHFPDLPMLSTLLGANLRTGRFVDLFRPAAKVVVYGDQAPPSDLASAMAGQTGSQKVYQNRKTLGSAPLASDGSVQLRLPALTPVVYELQDASGKALFTMTEEDQLGPGEYISRGVPQQFFNSVCAGCHGSVSGRELDVAINPDALTQASISLSRDPSKAVSIGP